MICGGCGGILGRDCFNEPECIWIGEEQSKAAYERDLAASYERDIDAAFLRDQGRLQGDSDPSPSDVMDPKVIEAAADARRKQIGYCPVAEMPSDYRSEEVAAMEAGIRAADEARGLRVENLYGVGRQASDTVRPEQSRYVSDWRPVGDEETAS